MNEVIEPIARRTRRRFGLPGPRLRRRTSVTLYKWALLTIGVVLLAAAPFSLPAPFPLGALLTAAGLVMLAKGSKNVRRYLRIARRRFPRGSAWLNRKKAKAPAGLRRFIERTDPERY